MSSFPTNIKDLEEMGYDISDYVNEDGDVTLDSWNYDELTYLLDDLICKLINKGVTFGEPQ